MAKRILNQFSVLRKTVIEKRKDNSIIYLSAALCEHIERLENKVSSFHMLTELLEDKDFQTIFEIKDKLTTLFLNNKSIAISL